MEVDRSDSENVAVEENVKPATEGGAGDAAPSHSDRIRRKNKKYGRTNSKEAVTNVTPLPKYRSWKNSRRPRNGHGRGLPKKGEFIYILNAYSGLNHPFLADKSCLLLRIFWNAAHVVHIAMHFGFT
jgi:hypothetical protein